MEQGEGIWYALVSKPIEEKDKGKEVDLPTEISDLLSISHQIDNIPLRQMSSFHLKMHVLIS